MPAETHSRGNPLGREDVTRLVRERLAELLSLDEDLIVPEARLRDDLDCDDYTLLDLAEALEVELGERTVALTFDDEELSELIVVTDVVEYVMVKIGSVIS